MEHFLGPLVFLDSAENLTLPVGVALFQRSYANEYGLTLAASVICTVPVMLIFFHFQQADYRGDFDCGIEGVISSDQQLAAVAKHRVFYRISKKIPRRCARAAELVPRSSRSRATARGSDVG